MALWSGASKHWGTSRKVQYIDSVVQYLGVETCDLYEKDTIVKDMVKLQGLRVRTVELKDGSYRMLNLRPFTSELDKRT